jgi:hypothetical protein
VIDYRSSIIQGKMLAKKGLWVSEFRVESGLNCGGHAFATEGYLLGPILNEFKENKDSLINELFETYTQGLSSINKNVPKQAPSVTFTAQGGVGTYEEHKFLLDHYGVDFVGWGSPFLLVPEVVNIDEHSMNLIAKEDESGFYLSNVSPLGILFNTVRGTSGEIEKQKRTDSGKPGAPCTKKHLIFNTEFTERPICAASVQYQKLKIDELKAKNLNPLAFKAQLKNVTDKVCLCVGLGNATLLKNNMKMKPGTQGVSVCPGPNMAYFSKIVSLKEMVDHIYGRHNIISRTDRPNMFIQELNMYINYLKERVEDITELLSKSQIKYFTSFHNNLSEGINYYKNLFPKINTSGNLVNALVQLENALHGIKIPEFQSTES